MSKLLLDNKANDGPFLISFVIPTYKNRIYLNKAIDSILNQKNTNKINFEVIVTSNFSDDNMEDLIERYKHSRVEMRLYKNEQNLGQVGNINQGVMLARGEYVSFLHDDDMLLPEYIDIITRFIPRDNNVDCIIPSMYIMKQEYSIDLKHRIASLLFMFRYLYRKSLQMINKKDHVYSYDNVYSAPTCGTIFKKEKIISYGYFKDVHGAAWDYYNYRCFHNDNNIFLLHRFVGIRREFTGMSNETRVQKDFRDDRLQMLETELHDNQFIERYHDVIITHKPLYLYVWFRVITRFYFYSHNLDAKIGISRKLFRDYSD